MIWGWGLQGIFVVVLLVSEGMSLGASGVPHTALVILSMPARPTRAVFRVSSLSLVQDLGCL